MEERIKNPLFAGYQYQNFVGLELLCGWLENPDRYKWVVFEADEDNQPQGLDDIVALRRDGTKELIQVKFCVKPDDEKYLLSWDWLLQQESGKRSLFQKWIDAFFENGQHVIDAKLVTNRRPDRDFESCLDHRTSRIDFAKIANEHRVRIDKQVGHERAEAFLQNFSFEHSHSKYKNLERQLQQRYRKFQAHENNWHVLCVEAVNWAVLKDSPPPNGRITLDHLRGVLGAHRPVPLDQGFRVPELYVPPDTRFVEAFQKRILNLRPRTTVLWGPPGQGKSTFLSYFCDKLDQSGTPYIQHHYFLSLMNAEDRISPFLVSNSLLHQMETRHPAFVAGKSRQPENLREWIEACARGYHEKGLPFVVIVDGLDHVWREREQDTSSLNELFQHLLPVPENTVLIVGTQKVDSEQLPKLLQVCASEDDWIRLAGMSLNATKQWLYKQLKAKRFKLTSTKYTFQKNLTELAERFNSLASGNPLHLTYTFQFIVREKYRIWVHDLDNLPDCPDGDVRHYYDVLWRDLPNTAKDALHLISAVDFIWPAFGLEICLDIRFDEITRHIAHLFDITEAGLVPFHGSILAFVRNQSEHSQRWKKLISRVTNWLEKDAPEYHKWGWSWLIEAGAGSSQRLVEMPNREWIVNSLCSGYPGGQLIAILAGAEQIAFRQGNFPRAARLRHLKTRVINGPNYQIDDFIRVHRYAMSLNSDEVTRANFRSNLQTASLDHLYLIAKQHLETGRAEEAVRCHEEMRYRLNDNLQSRNYDQHSIRTALHQFFEIAADTLNFDAKVTARNIRGFPELSDDLFDFFLSVLSKHEDLSALIGFIDCKLSKPMKELLDAALVRLSAKCDARIDLRPEFSRLRNHAIVDCWGHIHNDHYQSRIKKIRTIKLRSSHEQSYYGDHAIRQYVHNFFFHVIATTIELHGADPLISPQEFPERKWLNDALTFLSKVAVKAGELLARKETPGFAYCFNLLQSLPTSNDTDDRGDRIEFKCGVLKIAEDLFLLTMHRSGLKEIPDTELLAAKRSEYFPHAEWHKSMSKNCFGIVSQHSIEKEVNDRFHREQTRISEFNEKAEEFFECCELAFAHGLLESARKCLREAVSCIVGYGWHKDIDVVTLLEANQATLEHDFDAARATLLKIAPAITEINEFTDGRETSFSKELMAEQLLTLLPEAYVRYYQYLVKSSQWYEANRALDASLRADNLVQPEFALLANSLTSKRLASAFELDTLKDREIPARWYKQQQEYWGWDTKSALSDKEPTSDQNTEDYPFSVSDFLPNQIDKLLSEPSLGSRHMAERRALRDWFQYWESQNRGSDLLTAFKDCLKLENHFAFPSSGFRLLDEVFKVSLKLEGKKKAFEWLVVSHIHNLGWTEYAGLPDTLKRFELVGKHYRANWKEFIYKTSRSPFRWNSTETVIPLYRMVPFLFAVGEAGLAIETLGELTDAFLEDVSAQPIKHPSWLIAE